MTLFNEKTKALKANAEAYQKGEITAEQYFTTISERIDTIGNGFETLNAEVEGNTETTDLYEDKKDSLLEINLFT